MGSLTVFVALTWIAATTVLLCAQAAPVTEFFGPPQTIEGDSNVEYPEIDPPKKVEEMERFHRTYENGTVEFKMALSNGHVQYQRISSKLVDGDKVQVYEGYISEQYKDGRYGTRYYAADENGYRSSSVIVENEPPQLPTSGPYSTNLPRNIQNELSPLKDDDTSTKTKTLIDNLAELENDLEEDQLSNLNLGSGIGGENSIASKESDILKNLEKDEILEIKSIEEPAIIQNFEGVQTELPLNLDLPLSTELSSPSRPENNFGEVEPEASTLPAFTESSSIGVAVEASTEQPAIEAGNDTDKFEEPSFDTIKSIEEELAGRSLHPSTSSEILAEVVEDVKVPYEERIDNGTLLSDEVTSTVQETFSEVQEPNTGVPEIEEVKTEVEISFPLGYLQSNSTTLSPTAVILNSSDEGAKDLTEQPLLEVIEERSTESIESASSSSSPEIDDKITQINEFPTVKSEEAVASIEEIFPNLEVSTQKSFDEVSEPITGTFLNDGVPLTEQPAAFNNEDQEQSTQIPELNEVKTETETSSVSGFSREDAVSESSTDHISNTFAEQEDGVAKVLTDQSSLEITTDISTEGSASANEFNSDLSTSGVLPEINNYLPTEKIEVSTDLPLEDSTNTNDEAPREVSNEPQSVDISEKNGRSLDFSTELPLPENNSTSSIVEGSGSEEGNNNSDTSISSEISEETTNTIDISTEQPDSNEEANIATTVSGENNNEDAITEAEAISTTQKTDELEVVSLEGSHDTDAQISTEQSSASTSSEENSSEEINKEKSTEDESSTELSNESSDEEHSTTRTIEYITEGEVLSTTEEPEAKTSGLEVEFYTPVIHF